MARTASTKSAVSVKPASTTTTQCCSSDKDEIAKVAYKLYLERGGKHGSDVEDWMKAEAIVKAKKKKA